MAVPSSTRGNALVAATVVVWLLPPVQVALRRLAHREQLDRALAHVGEPLAEPGVFGGDSWFRSASEPSSSGDVVVSTRQPDEMWVRNAAGDFRSLGDNEGYVASLSLASDGATAYYAPGAHGQGAARVLWYRRGRD